jgi:30S ribosomal protein S31
MGKGDKRSKRGKIANGSFGKRRPHKMKVAQTTSPNTSAEKKE